MTWTIYYDDGSKVSAQDTTPQEAPAFGVIVIVQHEQDRHRFMLLEHDWYYWANNEWWGSDIHGVLDRLLHRLPLESLLQGRLTSKENYRAILKRADAENRRPD